VSLRDVVASGLRRGLSGQLKGRRLMPPELLASRRTLAKVVARRIAVETGIPADEILGRRRYAAIVAARRRVALELWRAPMSTTEVGEVLGMDHTSVIHALRRELGTDVYAAELKARRAPQMQVAS